MAKLFVNFVNKLLNVDGCSYLVTLYGFLPVRYTPLMFLRQSAALTDIIPCPRCYTAWLYGIE